ncbi:WD repeat-containing protein 78 isoform X2 [Fundulus heteroclitus]|uniref:WD repeat-containing protein 78 isoform X2 n=1 Tax=Fundulus heteroclitus TaxID=8078 RepID=UPI00165C54FC|nr:WD repeat-containing protein 78 isoform X2 [Fundulus heteroclitus]
MEKEMTPTLLSNSFTGTTNSSGSGEFKVSRRSNQKIKFAASLNHNNNSDKSSNSVPHKKAIKVLDAQRRDVTPLALGPTHLEDPQSKKKPLSLDDLFFNTGANIFKSSSVADVASSRLFCSSFSSMSTMESGLLSRSCKTEDSFPLQDVTPPPPVHSVPLERKGLPEENPDQGFDVTLTETDTFSLLDISPTIISEDAEGAEAVKQRNIHYAEFCKSRMANDNYSERSTQAFVGEPKTKHVQTNKNSSVNKSTTATSWDMYDSLCKPVDAGETQEADQEDYFVSTKKEKDKAEGSLSGDTGSTLTFVVEMETCVDSLTAESDQDKIVLSESFQNSLLVMERVVVLNIFQPMLAAFRGLPVLKDPYSTEKKPVAMEQSTEDKDWFLTPTLERLWAFACPLSIGRNITSMTWNKRNPDILAVGYGDWSSGSPKPGLVCCWSLKNLMWSERIFPCHSSVTCLDFSANNPGQLAVGMYDGSVAIYNIQAKNQVACIANSRDTSKRHQQPVWQVIWTKQQLQLSGEERDEVLVSVSGDGRITKWLMLSDGFNCIDLMVVKRIQDRKEKPKGNQEKIENVLLPVTPVLCVDFHPTDAGIYVIGTWDARMHKCSFSNSAHFLDTYNKHFSPVTQVEWSRFYPDVFLSCSADWTIQLWQLDTMTPKMSFTSVQSPVDSIKWSPNCSMVFAAVYRQRMEVWDLSSSILLPTAVHHAEPGVTLGSVLLAKGSDCVLVGDSGGRVTVYKLKNFRAGKQKQVNNLDDIMQAVPGSLND